MIHLHMQTLWEAQQIKTDSNDSSFPYSLIVIFYPCQGLYKSVDWSCPLYTSGNLEKTSLSFYFILLSPSNPDSLEHPYS